MGVILFILLLIFVLYCIYSKQIEIAIGIAVMIFAVMFILEGIFVIKGSGRIEEVLGGIILIVLGFLGVLFGLVLICHYLKWITL